MPEPPRKPVCAAAPANPALVAAVTRPDQVPAALAAGADLIDLSALDLSAVGSVASDLVAAYPEVAFCARASPAQLARLQASGRGLLSRGLLSRELLSRGWLICASPPSGGIGPTVGELLVEVPPAGLGQAIEAGLRPLVDADRAAASAGSGGLIAIVALSAWLGAAAVRTRQLPQARRALDMTASIAGLRAPVRTVRGLA